MVLNVFMFSEINFVKYKIGRMQKHIKQIQKNFAFGIDYEKFPSLAEYYCEIRYFLHKMK